MPTREIAGELPDDVVRFLNEVVSNRGREHWEWKYLGRNTSGPSAFYWREEDGSVSGFLGLMRTSLQTAASEHPAAWFVDWYVRPGSQGGVGFALLRKAEASAGALLTLQGSADTRQILPRLGWRETSAPRTFVRPLGGRFVANWARLRLPPPLRPFAAVAGAIAAPALRCPKPPAPTGWRLVAVPRFPHNYDAVWRKRRNEFAPAMRRDSEYLNFLCSDYPDGGYTRFLLEADGDAVGHLILRIGRDARGLQRGRIVDALWPRQQTNVLEWLVRHAAWQLHQDGADYAECLSAVPDLSTALEQARFRSRSSVPVWYRRLPADASDPALWYITLLDCDRAYR